MDDDAVAPSPEFADADHAGDADMSNEQFRSLVLRSQFADDAEATRELSRYLLGKVYWLAQTFPPHRRSEVVKALVDASARAAKVAVSDKRYVALPRNYTIRAMTNAFIDEQRREARRQGQEAPHDPDNGPPRHGAPDPERPRAELRPLLVEFQREAETVQDRRIAEVLIVAYLCGCSVRKACSILSCGRSETDSVRTAIERDTKHPESRLSLLVRDLRRKSAEQNSWEL